MKVKKLCKKVKATTIINVYEKGYLQCSENPSNVASMYGERKIKNITAWYDEKPYEPALWINLK